MIRDSPWLQYSVDLCRTSKKSFLGSRSQRVSPIRSLPYHQVRSESETQLTLVKQGKIGPRNNSPDTRLIQGGTRMRRSARTDLCRGDPRWSSLPPHFGILLPRRGLYPASSKLYALLVSFRCPIVFVLAVLLAAAPLLSCLPTSSMTDSEMACCKKMAGNCDMGTGNHSCCKTTVSTPQLVAISHNSQVYQPDGLVVVQRVFTNANAGLTSEVVRVVPSPIPISPPGSQSVLRI